MTDLILLGHIARAFGIEGGVVIKLVNQDSQSLEVGRKLLLKLPSRQERVVTIKMVMHGERVFFDEISDRTQAEALKSAEVLLDRADFPVLDDDEFYLADLLHARVIDENGDEAGEVVGFSSNGPQTLLEIKTTSGYLALVPAVKPLIKHIDYTAKIVTVDASTGVLDPMD